jgi:hypothetical protein
MIRFARTRLTAALSLLIVVAVLLPGCAFMRLARSEKIKVPEVTYLRTVIKSYDNEKAVVDFVLNAKNPNKIGLKNVAVDYELFHEGRAFLKGDGINVELAPSGDTEIRIPAVIAYTSVFSTAYALTQRIIAGDSTVPVRLDALVSGKPTLYNEVESGSLFSFSKKLTRTEQIPIPRQQIDGATEAAKRRALEEIRKRF